MGVHRTKADKQKAALHRQQTEYRWNEVETTSAAGSNHPSATVPSKVGTTQVAQSSSQSAIRPSSPSPLHPTQSLSAVNRIIRVDPKYLRMDLRRSLIATAICLIALVGIWWWGRYNGVSY